MFDRLEEAAALARAEFEALGTETARPSDDQLTEDVSACQRAINALTAVQAVRMAQYAAREDVRHEDGTIGQRDFPVGHVSPFAAAVIGPELGLGARAAEDRVGISARVVSTMPGTLRAMASGELDWHRARVVATELQDSSPDVVAEVEDRLFPAALRDSAGEVRRRCRRILQRVDSASLVERARRSRESRGLQRWQGEPGVEEWHALLPAEQAATAWQAVDDLARRYQREDREHAGAGAATTLEQARGDALLDLILGHASVQTSMVFTVPETFAQSGGQPRAGCVADSGGTEGVVQVPGVGVVPWSGIGSLATSFATQISIASCDPANGALTGMATEVYRPPSALTGSSRTATAPAGSPGVRRPRCGATPTTSSPGRLGRRTGRT